MNCSFTQRYFATFNTALKALLLCLLTLVLGLSLSAQERDELHRGTWQIDTPEDGALILIVKRNGLASSSGATMPTALSIGAAGITMTAPPP